MATSRTRVAVGSRPSAVTRSKPEHIFQAALGVVEGAITFVIGLGLKGLGVGGL